MLHNLLTSPTFYFVRFAEAPYCEGRNFLSRRHLKSQDCLGMSMEMHKFFLTLPMILWRLERLSLKFGIIQKINNSGNLRILRISFSHSLWGRYVYHDTDSQFLGALQQDCGKWWGSFWKLPSELLAPRENQEGCACLENNAGFLGGRGMLKIDLDIKNWKLLGYRRWVLNGRAGFV